MHLTTIIWKVENGIGHLVLNQPPANTMTRLFFEELGELTRSVIPGSSAGALVIYGKGRHFSSGADHLDLKTRIASSCRGDNETDLPDFMRQTMDSFIFLHKMQIPTFAAIRGTCLGSALELALTCKYRICAEGTVLGFPETSFGLMPGCGGTVRTPEICGYGKAIELIIGGCNFTAGDALKYGLVHRVVPKKALLDETIQMAQKMIKPDRNK